MLLASGCSNQNTTGHDQPNSVIDTSCSSFSPIYTYGDDYKTMDVRTVRQINTHNQVWEQLCGSENGRVK